MANYYIGRHLKWLCSKHDLGFEDAQFLLPWELDRVIAHEKSMQDFPLKERKEESIHIYDEYGRESFLTGNDARKMMRQFVPDVEEGIAELKGTTVWEGKVIGSVRVVLDPHSVKQFNDGDILVTGMTRPDYLGIMKKAAAFITDEGGITCHAAIIAREMQKPCIIGTKIATKVLKDRDMVEVDADKGIVRIMKEGRLTEELYRKRV